MWSRVNHGEKSTTISMEDRTGRRDLREDKKSAVLVDWKSQKTQMRERSQCWGNSATE